MYNVRIKKSVQKELDRVPGSAYERIRQAILSLAANPRPPGSVKLEDDIYRVRRGNFRIIYRIDDETKTVMIGAVRKRDERTYERLYHLFD